MVKFNHWLWRLQSDCWDCSQIAEIAIWFLILQSDCWVCTLIAGIAVWLLRLQSDCWDGCLIAEIAVWFWRWVKIGGPEIEASYWLRAHNRGLLLVEKTGFKQIQGIGLLFRNLCHSTHFRFQSCQSDCNLHNQTAISTIRVQGSRNLPEYPRNGQLYM